MQVLEAAKKSNKDYDQAREASNKAFSGYVNAFDEYLQYEKTGIVYFYLFLMLLFNF